MAMFIKCPCGEKYQTDEKHLGYSIKCRNCNHIIAISEAKANSYSSNARSNSTYSKNSTIFEDVSVEAKTPFLKNIVIPITGALALLVGIYLTVNNVREQKNIQSNNDNSTKSLASVITPPNSPIAINANTLNKNQTVSNSSNKTTEIAQINSNNQSTNATQEPSAKSIQESPSPTPEIVRYANGKNLITPQNTGGRGTLLISNGTSLDAIAKLVDINTNRTIRLTYIQANSDFTIKNIRVGSYILKFSLGNGYIPDTGKFQYSQSFSRFDDVLSFDERREGNTIVWDNFSVTLNKVLHGNARTSTIDESDFEDK